MTYASLIPIIVVIVSAIATAAAAFYTVAGRTTRDLPKENNTALAETNKRLESENAEYKLKIASLENRITVLESLKTPSLDKVLKAQETTQRELTALVKAVNSLVGKQK